MLPTAYHTYMYMCTGALTQMNMHMQKRKEAVEIQVWCAHLLPQRLVGRGRRILSPQVNLGYTA